MAWVETKSKQLKDLVCAGNNYLVWRSIRSDHSNTAYYGGLILFRRQQICLQLFRGTDDAANVIYITTKN